MAAHENPTDIEKAPERKREIGKIPVCPFLSSGKFFATQTKTKKKRNPTVIALHSISLSLSA